MNILVTGAAGFIGMHLSECLLQKGYRVIGLDNLNAYYDINLKYARLERLKQYKLFKFYKENINDTAAVMSCFKENNFDIVINLAAQAGVRYSIVNPYAYIESNIEGFINILEASRQFEIKHLVYASSSSVYGANIKKPFSTADSVDHPVSLYAATKKSNELMAHTYSHLFGLPTTGLRFFTVYGPYGRPDMAYFLFTKDILDGKDIKIFNQGNMKRDFTYIDDIVDGVLNVIKKPPIGNIEWDRNNPEPSTSYAPYRIYNIGNNKPVNLMDFINILEKHLGKEANKEFLPMQQGDVEETFADIDDLTRDFGFKPSICLDKGIENFVNWYKEFYKI